MNRGAITDDKEAGYGFAYNPPYGLRVSDPNGAMARMMMRAVEQANFTRNHLLRHCFIAT
jgi:hypothetical protein